MANITHSFGARCSTVFFTILRSKIDLYSGAIGTVIECGIAWAAIDDAVEFGTIFKVENIVATTTDQYFEILPVA